MNATLPLDQQFLMDDLELLKSNVAGTKIGDAFLSWYRLREKLETNSNKQDRAANVFQDRLMVNILHEEAQELKRDSDALEQHISTMAATSLNDVLCKLAMWRLSQCPMADCADGDALVAASAFSDLVGFALRRKSKSAA